MNEHMGFKLAPATRAALKDVLQSTKNPLSEADVIELALQQWIEQAVRENPDAEYYTADVQRRILRRVPRLPARRMGKRSVCACERSIPNAQAMEAGGRWTKYAGSVCQWLLASPGLSHQKSLTIMDLRNSQY
jgi:hypothetical protein